ncbi:GxxExxY protein [Sorangium sp. So ce367]|uniref:GxxExxY protein n=1 Tax=Sorangium sp. So ce367 TaxID=3133305 RepID=UPI003F6273A5
MNAKAQRRKDAKRDVGSMEENDVAEVVVDAAIEVHRTLGGPGLLESVYEEAFAFEPSSRGLNRQRSAAVNAKLTLSAFWRLCVFASLR